MMLIFFVQINDFDSLICDGLLILPVCESPQVDWTGESLKYTCFIFWESKISTDESDVQLDPPAEKKHLKKIKLVGWYESS